MTTQARSTAQMEARTVTRELTESGVRESFRAIPPQDAGLEQFAIHVTDDDAGHDHAHEGSERYHP